MGKEYTSRSLQCRIYGTLLELLIRSHHQSWIQIAKRTQNIQINANITDYILQKHSMKELIKDQSEMSVALAPLSIMVYE